MTFALIPVLLSMTIAIIIPVLIGVYVYRDASRRGMNAALWTLVAVLSPTLLGLIIYLLVRGSYSALKCPGCAATVTEQYVVCPKCGAKIKASCGNCGFPLEAGWTVCPKCTSPLTEYNDDFTPPVQEKDTGLGKILTLVIVIPVLLLLFVAIFSFGGHTEASSVNAVYLSVEHYRDRPEILEWIDDCNEDTSKIYAIYYQEELGGQKLSTYLIYRPAANKTPTVSAENVSVLFGNNIEVRFHEIPGQGKEEYNLTAVTSISNKTANLRVFINDKSVNCESMGVDYSPAFFELDSEQDNPSNVPAVKE